MAKLRLEPAAPRVLPAPTRGCVVPKAVSGSSKACGRSWRGSRPSTPSGGPGARQRATKRLTWPAFGGRENCAHLVFPAEPVEEMRVSREPRPHIHVEVIRVRRVRRGRADPTLLGSGAPVARCRSATSPTGCRHAKGPQGSGRRHGLRVARLSACGGADSTLWAAAAEGVGLGAVALRWQSLLGARDRHSLARAARHRPRALARNGRVAAALLCCALVHGSLWCPAMHAGAAMQAPGFGRATKYRRRTRSAPTPPAALRWGCAERAPYQRSTSRTRCQPPRAGPCPCRPPACQSTWRPGASRRLAAAP